MLGVKAQRLEEICLRHKCSYTRFDYRGHGESAGEPAAFTLSDWLKDTLLVLDAIQQPIVLVGSSMGGWLATLAANRRRSKVDGLLLLASAPDFFNELVQPRLSTSEYWDLQQGLVVNLPTRYEHPYPLTQKLLDSGNALSVFKPGVGLNDYRVGAESENGSETSLENLTCQIHLIHGTADSDVPYDLSIRLMKEFKHAKARLTLLHQADHRLSDERSLACIEHELRVLVDEARSRA